MAPDQRVCSACGTENPERAKFCLECGTRLAIDIVEALPQEATGGERRIVTVVFADLSGFTSFSEQTDVEEVRAIAHETADRLGEIVERYGGTVDKVIGDCVMAVFGAPTSHEDDPERAVRAALDMQAHTKEHAERFAGLGLSVGVNTGEAIWAPVGGQYTVLGDTVNTAARLQGAADKGEILVGTDTYSATHESVEYETLLPIVMKNKREPVPAYKALSVHGEVRRRRTRSLPLVGREAERERLWELWDHVRTDRQPFGALAIGAPGIGKSRLLQAVVDDIGKSATVLRGSCLPYGEGITYWPIIEMIKQAAGILYDDDHEAVSDKLGAFLEALGSEDLDELRTMAVALANLVGEPTTPRGTYTATEISRGELHWGLRRIIELTARSQPVVLVIEDLHWAEPALLELILYLLEPRTDTMLVGLGTARPELVETHPAFCSQRSNFRTLELQALPEDSAIEIVRRLIGEGDIPDDMLQQLLDAAGGNPLFLEEMIQTWVDAGARPEHLAQIDVPSGLQALIASRLDRLPPIELRVLSHASVMGDVFWSGALSALEAGNGEIDGVLAALEERDLVRFRTTTSVTGQREYAFKHGLIREVAYGRLPKSERVLLHERAGNWIGTIGEDEFAEIIAYHLEEACKLAAEVARSANAPPLLAAVNALKRAAEKSEAREGIREAARFYDRAIGLLGSRYPETNTELRLNRGRAQIALGEFDRAYADLSDVARQATDIGRADLRCWALVNLVEAGMTLGRIAEARTHLEEAEAAAALSDDPRDLIRVPIVRALLRGSVDGSVDEAERDLRSAVEIAEEARDHALLIAAKLYLGTFAFNAGRLKQAEQAFQDVVSVARERGSLQDEAAATGFLAAALYHLGPRVQAERSARQAVTWLERLDDRHQQSQALRLLGKLALDRDDPAEAQLLFTEALKITPPHQLLLAMLNRLLAEARARQGRAIGARAAAAAAGDAAPDDEPYAQAFAAVADGCAGTAEGADDAAREGFDRAITLLEQLNMSTDLAEARVSFARALTRFGDPVGAKEQLVAARGVFEDMGAAASVSHVDDLLAKTAEGADLFGPLG